MEDSLYSAVGSYNEKFLYPSAHSTCWSTTKSAIIGSKALGEFVVPMLPVPKTIGRDVYSFLIGKSDDVKTIPAQGDHNEFVEL